MTLTPPSRDRLVATLLAIIGTLVAPRQSTFLCLGAWLFLVLPLIYLGGILRAHLYAVATLLLPMLLALLLVWGLLVGAAPGEQLGSAPLHGVEFAVLTFTRLALLTSFLQLCFGTIPPGKLHETLYSWGLRGEVLLIIVATISMFPEARLRADQVITARYARGLVENRAFTSRLKNLPYLIRPLLAWMLRSGIQRAEYWQQRQLILRFNDQSVVPNSPGNSLVGFLLKMSAISWLGMQLWLRYG